MNLKAVAPLIVAIFSLALLGCSKEKPDQATEPQAVTPDNALIPAEHLKQTKTKLLGKWTISSHATKALPVDTAKYPWMPEKLEQLIKEGLSYEFRVDETAIVTFSGRSENEGYRLLQDETGDVWIAITSGGEWDLHRAKFTDGDLQLTSLARDDNDEEVPIVGTLVLSRTK